ncbi:MAG: hypothetical protein HY558_03745 [Euryarchaeota archaeon]|nr:hypothetical protein [Euryarchaeota archaeon]
MSNISVGTILGSENTDEPVVTGTKALALTIVRQNPDGITAKGLASKLDVTTRRATVILEELCNARETYSRKLPDVAARLYYPNGRLIHKYLQESRELSGDQVFRLSIHEGRAGSRFQIQERRFTLLEGEKMEGSIFIDSKNIQPFLVFVHDMLEKFNNYTEKKEEAK